MFSLSSVCVRVCKPTELSTMFQSGTPGAVGGTQHNPMKDFEVQQPPDDSISKLTFSSAAATSNFLVASSWDNNVSFLST